MQWYGYVLPLKRLVILISLIKFHSVLFALHLTLKLVQKCWCFSLATSFTLFIYFCLFSPFYLFIFISWRLFSLQYCSGFCHTLKWNSHGFTCVPHPDPPSHLPLHPIPLVLPSAPGPSACLMHPTWAGDLFHPW